MKVSKNSSFGQLYVQLGHDGVRIPATYATSFLDECHVPDNDRAALDSGKTIQINQRFTIAQKYEG